MQQNWGGKSKWHVTCDTGVKFVSTSNGILLKVKQRNPTQLDQQGCFTETVVIIVDSNSKPKAVRALLNTGCSKSIILR